MIAAPTLNWKKEPGYISYLLSISFYKTKKFIKIHSLEWDFFTQNVLKVIHFPVYSLLAYYSFSYLLNRILNVFIK